MPVVRLGRTPALSTDVNRLFATFFDTPTARATNGTVRRWIPAMDIVEAGEHFVVKADLPGLTEADVTVEIKDNALTIAGERKSEIEERHAGFYRVERTSGSFSRTLALPEGLDPESVTATFANGVLEVRFPKPVRPAPHRVQIAVGGGEPQTIEGETTDAPAERPAA